MKAGGSVAGDMAAAGGRRRLDAALLVATPAMAVLAVAAMAAVHDASTEPDIVPCMFGYVPPHQGYEEEIRALVSRAGWPVWWDGHAYGLEWLVGYVENNSRAKSRLGIVSDDVKFMELKIGI